MIIITGEYVWFNILSVICLIYCIISGLLFILIGCGASTERKFVWTSHKIILNHVIALIVNFIMVINELAHTKDGDIIVVSVFVLLGVTGIGIIN